MVGSFEASGVWGRTGSHEVHAAGTVWEHQHLRNRWLRRIVYTLEVVACGQSLVTESLDALDDLPSCELGRLDGGR